ncbi:uncharacterized protein BO87DRAFT_399104 [Aspergillus neoniger CBS 115656]|uniref:Uncharacterized protein n=1 Tax=Aspergillus neoniger (strain CBS 115656) TaxID=1448310 RepID=A0A318YCA3_ASPNB|nr:hypothetical protein BO87DRAFT_399104 [Aspergillus neoniger CBS 115656]PYH32035.1 hypothetical protein BO87DRAFT_399104 [Aspergillus neoniger CBS 115656]
MESNGREDIALLCLAYRETLDDDYESLIGELTSLARTYLANHSPKKIIVTDGGISEPENQDIAKRLKAYLEDGGSVTFALDFASSISGDEFNNLFGRKFGTPWEYDDRCKTICKFNGNCIVPAGPVPNCPYNMEAYLIKNASPIERIVVVPLESSTVRPKEQGQAAVVGRKQGKGYLIYCGNESVEEEVCKMVLLMCN